jgi:tRNA nucleotidyltransferase/poly(A) polymerase
MKFKSFYLIEDYSKETSEKIAKIVKENNGIIYIVGGAVRDELIGIKPKDIDFLVTGIPLEKLSEILKPIGKVNEVGKSFGIIKATIDGEEYDFAIPRKETSTGHGHKDQITKSDHNLSVEDDLSRRDFTFNAIAKELEFGKFIDPYGGKSDIKNKIIRAVGNPQKRFEEDPLRILRAIQFAVRFEFDIEKKTKEAIYKNIDLLEHLPSERFLEEFKKAITKSKEKENSKFVDLLIDTGIGNLLFGEEFNPIKIKTTDYVVNLIALFVNGGNYKKLKLPNEEDAIIELARKLTGEIITPWLFVKNKNYVEFVKSFMEQTNHKNLNVVTKILKYPMTLKELEVTGDDLIEFGIQNVNIGKITNKILEAIWTGDIKNTKDDILKFLDK